MSQSTSILAGTWRYPTDIHFGAGRISELPETCKALGVSRPLLVTDAGLAKLPMVSDALAANEKAGLPTRMFSDIQPNPIEANIRAGADVYREGRHDGIIAFGGGSALDSGKNMALAAQNTVSLWDFDVTSPNFVRDREVDLPPIIAVPTTAGTGSEVGRAAVVTDESTHTKRILAHTRIMPSAVIADPELTLGLPAHITAATGMDALAHSLEAFCANVEYHPMADGIALEGMRLVKEWLPEAVKNGANIEARSHMMAAASMGATAFQKGLGAIHALSHPLGALLDIHHGLANAVLMPYVMIYNRPAIEDRMTRLARYLGLPKPGFEATLDWILELRDGLGIPHKLTGLGIDETRIGELASMAARDPCAQENPVPAGAGEMKSMYLAALEGKLG
ncbi:MAG: iron-containing alcohol dehydrogenase [Alphaproteobacteria bacterium]